MITRCVIIVAICLKSKVKSTSFVARAVIDVNIMSRKVDKLFHEYTKRAWADFIDLVGSENYPLHKDGFRLEDLDNPDPYLKDKKDYFCFLHCGPDHFQFGKFICNTGFVVFHEFNAKKLRKYFDENRELFEYYDREYQEQNWALWKKDGFEHFQEDTENISEGIVEIREYYEDNSIKSRQLVDAITGEQLYFRRYYQTTYFDEQQECYKTAVTSFYLYDGKKEYIAEKTKVNHRYKWKVTYPAMYKGRYLEDMYFQKYGKR